MPSKAQGQECTFALSTNHLVPPNSTFDITIKDGIKNFSYSVNINDTVKISNTKPQLKTDSSGTASGTIDLKKISNINSENGIFIITLGSGRGPFCGDRAGIPLTVGEGISAISGSCTISKNSVKTGESLLVNGYNLPNSQHSVSLIGSIEEEEGTFPYAAIIKKQQGRGPVFWRGELKIPERLPGGNYRVAISDVPSYPKGLKCTPALVVEGDPGTLPPPCKEGLSDPKNPDSTTIFSDQIKKCTKVETAIGDISTEPKEFVEKIFALVLGVAGGIAVILIIVSGYRFMASQGNPEQVQAAREQLTSAIVGLLFIIFSFVILQIIGVNILRIPGFG